MNSIWREILLITLFNLGVLCFLMGLFLSIAPKKFLDATSRMNRWISTDAAFASLDRPRPVDRYFYRRHLWVGVVLLSGGIYILYVFWAWYDRAQVLTALPVIHNVAASAWIYDSLVILLRGTGVVGVLAGVVVLLRPSLLKSLEAKANRWISTEQWTKPLDRQKELPTQWFPGHAQWFGIAITAGSLYIMWRCSRLLWGIG